MNLKPIHILMTACVAVSFCNLFSSGLFAEEVAPSFEGHMRELKADIDRVERERDECLHVLEPVLRQRLETCESSTSAIMVDPSADERAMKAKSTLQSLVISAQSSLNTISLACNSLGIVGADSSDVDALNDQKRQIRNKRGVVLNQLLLAYLDHQDFFNVEGQDHTTDVTLVRELHAKFRMYDPGVLWALLSKKNAKMRDGTKVPGKTDWPKWYIETYLPEVIKGAAPADLDSVSKYVNGIGVDRSEDKETLLASIAAKRG